jgi:hypothetical protein
MGSRLRPSILATALLISLIAPLQPVVAATESATPTSSSTPNVSPTVTSTPTAKPTPKPTVTKKAPQKTPKKSTKKKKLITPSPKPVWPPKGFIVNRDVNGDVYAKVPTSKELVGIISAQRSLATQIKKCTDFICGAIQVASATGCVWWEAKSKVFNGAGVELGALTSAHSTTQPREIKTIITVSPEPATFGGRAKFISVICHRDKRDTNFPIVRYDKIENSVTP